MLCPEKSLKESSYVKTANKVWHTLIITHQGNSQFKNCKIDLLTQEYKKFSIFNEETIDSGFTLFNAIVTSLKSLDTNYSNKNHVRKFLRALLLKLRARVTAIEEAKDLATLPLDELTGNLKVYEMVLDNDGAGSKTTKEKVKSLALFAKVTMEKTTDDNDSQGGSDEDIDKEEAEAFNLLARNFCKFIRKGNRFGRGNRFGNGANRIGRGRDILDLQKENEKLLKFNKDFTTTFEKLLKEKCSLENVCLKCDLLPDDWIVDSGCTKHMTGNRRLFTLYKAYDGGHVIFWSNLKIKDVGRGNIAHDSITITNVEHVSDLAFNLISVGQLCDDDCEVSFTK
ncbi:hypothetical protein Tco_0287742 [Tanacetum coccineum]